MEQITGYSFDYLLTPDILLNNNFKYIEKGVYVYYHEIDENVVRIEMFDNIYITMKTGYTDGYLELTIKEIYISTFQYLLNLLGINLIISCNEKYYTHT